MEHIIKHYRQIDIIRKAEEDFYNISKIKPFDISHWNSGDEYKSQIMRIAKFPKIDEYLDYMYSYSFNDEIKQRISSIHNADNAKCALFNNSTSAIATTIMSLKAMNYKSIYLIQPSYFSVYEYLSILGFDIICVNYKYDGGYHIPFELIEKDVDLVWITQPVFSTGTYIPDEEIITLINEFKFVIIDYSMSNVINYTTPSLINYNKTICIFSPQKPVSMNGIKFSYVLCNEDIAKRLQDWCDVISGSLSSSCILAIYHFLSSNYVLCSNEHKTFINKSHKEIDKIISGSGNLLTKCGHSVDNTYETLTINSISYREDINYDFLYDFITKTHVSLTPGVINGFDIQNGFCFRINHTLDISKNKIALYKIISYLDHQ